MSPKDVDIQIWRLALGYLLLLIPLSICLWYRIGLIKQTLIGAIRMTVQLVLVGFYLDVIFRLQNPWLTGLWLLVMIVVADVSVLRHCGFRLRPFVGPLFVAMVVWGRYSRGHVPDRDSESPQCHESLFSDSHHRHDPGELFTGQHHWHLGVFTRISNERKRPFP